MSSVRPVFLVIGLFVAVLGIAMLIPAAFDLFAEGDRAQDSFNAFLASSLICVVLGGGMSVSTWGRIETITTRQGFVITTLSWVALVLAAAVPLTIGNGGLSLTDGIFESMSALTTTGSTVVTGLESRPPGFLVWRSMLQWFGGIGVIIMAIAILPFLSVGGMQLFRLESSDKSDKIMPGADDLAAAVFNLYLVLTAACFFSYWIVGMSAFDAFNHAMTTVATGGFSTKDSSFAYFVGDPDMAGPADLVAVVFMILGALPFTLYLLALRGNLNALLFDSQVRFFMLAVLGFTAVVAFRIMASLGFDGMTAVRLALFNIVSIITGTGYASANYGAWGPFALGIFFVVMFLGGCAGSTSCGLKIFRFQVAISALIVYTQKLSHPHRTTVARYNGRPLDEGVFRSVLSFFFIYFMTFATTAVGLSLFSLDPVTALSAAGTAIANVGPGLGDVVGPAGNFASLPGGAKWILCLAMLLGRLELLTVMVLFLPSFWVR
ncbi:TrkH family potassium uptake protein [Parvularcula sp. ZS-1/3]|uniref:Trk system potassium uptake protein n=1 Tax=Parvularcula mediterranea TaxID=2732508 RepID=A0A7Y3W572_9PROT|nr:TrkH family potassium uptake protein [Parvularcula mediterranea]NNU15997.1 TrkH family potassium uptake protein [Parvularcula mediterranea]